MKALLLTAFVIGVWVVPISQGTGQPEKGVVEGNRTTKANSPQKREQDKQSAQDKATQGVLAQTSQIEQKQAQILKAYKDQQDQDANISGKLTEYTFWLVVVGVLQAFILAGTVWAIIQQTLATKNSERAWVLVERVCNPVEGWRNVIYPSLLQSYIPGIVFEFKVYGNTPIKVIEGAFDLILVPNKKGVVPPAPDLPEIPDYSKAFPLPHLPKDGVPWAPSGTNQIRRTISLTPKQIEAVSEYQVILCGYGYLKYLDAFGKNRETRVCYIYYINYGGVLRTPDGIILNPEGFYMGGPSEYNKAT